MTLGSSGRLLQVLQSVAKIIDDRALSADEDSSYTARLLAKGPQRTAKKLGEETVELVIALTSQSDEEVLSETADVLYHLLVALRSRGVSLDQIAQMLAERQGISGLAEKAARKSDGI